MGTRKGRLWIPWDYDYNLNPWMNNFCNSGFITETMEFSKELFKHFFTVISNFTISYFNFELIIHVCLKNIKEGVDVIN